VRTKELLTKLAALRVEHEDGNKYITLEVSWKVGCVWGGGGGGDHYMQPGVSNGDNLPPRRACRRASCRRTWIASCTTWREPRT
jgi:hypothetical protein